LRRRPNGAKAIALQASLGIPVEDVVAVLVGDVGAFSYLPSPVRSLIMIK
jgi:hypothetical protein